MYVGQPNLPLGPHGHSGTLTSPYGHNAHALGAHSGYCPSPVPYGAPSGGGGTGSAHSVPAETGDNTPSAKKGVFSFNVSCVVS